MIELFNILFKWKLPIALACVLALVLSVIFSLMKPNYYQSTVKFFPANPYMIDRSSMFSKTPGENPQYIFGSGQEIDRLISIGQSQPLKNYVINKYNLLEHYKIDKNDALHEFKVNKAFDKNYEIIKNALDVIEVSVEDVDRELASKMANDIVKKIDETHIDIVNNSKLEMAKMLDYTISELNGKLDNLNDRITKSIRRGAQQDVAVLDEVKNNFIEDLSEAQVVKEQYLTLASSKMSSIYLIQEAKPAFYKSRPQRSIIVLSSLLLTFIACSLIAIIYEQIKKFNSTN